MCGRYSLRDPIRVFEEFSVLDRARRLDARWLEPRYNVAPSQPVPVVRVLERSEGRQLDHMKWGLPPARKGKPVLMIRADALARGAFRSALTGRRCIMLADGFYEWSAAAAGRVPHYAKRRDGGALGIAAIWSPGPTGGTSALITKPAIAPLVALHDRMPAILAPADYARWLDPEQDDADVLGRMLTADLPLELTAVGPWVNSPRNDGPRCIEPIAQGPGQAAPSDDAPRSAAETSDEGRITRP